MHLNVQFSKTVKKTTDIEKRTTLKEAVKFWQNFKKLRQADFYIVLVIYVGS